MVNEGKAGFLMSTVYPRQPHCHAPGPPQQVADLDWPGNVT